MRKTLKIGIAYPFLWGIYLLVATLKKSRSLEASLIYQRLAALGWRVDRLAEVASLSKGYVYNLILGNDTSSPGRRRIEKALGISIWAKGIPPKEPKALNAKISRENDPQAPLCLDTYKSDFAGVCIENAQPSRFVQ